MTRQHLLIVLIPVLVLAAAGLIALSHDATPALFGLFLSIAAWLLGIALIGLPALLVRRRMLARDRQWAPEAKTP